MNRAKHWPLGHVLVDVILFRGAHVINNIINKWLAN